MTPRPWFISCFLIYFSLYVFLFHQPTPFSLFWSIFLPGLLDTLQVYLDTGIVVTAPGPLIIIPLDNIDKCRPHDSLIGSDLETALTEGSCMHTLVH